MPTTTPPVQGIFHTYAPSLTAFQFGVDGSPKNAIIFIGGLGDGYLTVPYVAPLAYKLRESTQNDWTVVQALITSSYTGWGTSSLAKDAKELGLLVKYLKHECGFQKIVLMGHSTGCQDTLTYLTKSGNVADLDGAILQAPVSDRETISQEKHKLDSLLEIVKREYIDQGKSNHLLPQEFRKIAFNTPITAYRFYSVFSERGDDDYFSSYLTSDDFSQTFATIKTPLLVLYSGHDEFVPEFVDKQAIINKWKASMDPKYWSNLSRVIDGASHNVGPNSTENAVENVIETVIEFISTI